MSLLLVTSFSDAGRAVVMQTVGAGQGDIKFLLAASIADCGNSE